MLALDDSRIRTGSRIVHSAHRPWLSHATQYRTTIIAPTCSINRYYDPSTDSFISVDPDVQQTDQPYAFVNDDPLNATDPSGLSGQEIINEAIPCTGNCTGESLVSVISDHWRGLAQIATIAVGLAGCATVVGCVLLGAATGGAFYAEGSAGTSNYSVLGQFASIGAGSFFGAANGEGQVLIEKGSEQVTQTFDKGLLRVLANPIESANAVAKGLAKVASGATVKVSAEVGDLICDAHRRCP